MSQISSKENTGWITNIQRFSIDDGPGIRTTVFLKGCTLNCIWCHNPECIQSKPQIQFHINRCTLCEACIDACPSGAQQIFNGKRIFNRAICKSIGDCIEACNHGALELVGKKIFVNEVITEIVKDRVFYNQSGGGVTISGGEPLMQTDFTYDILANCKSNGIHTAVDTAGHVLWPMFEKVIPYTDLFLYDLKCINNEEHLTLTGSSNSSILDNLTRLSRTDKEIWIRIPMIPGINDSIQAIHELASFINKLDNIKKIQLIPYHKYGLSKYTSLGLNYSLKDILEYTEEMKNNLLDVFLTCNIKAEY